MPRKSAHTIEVLTESCNDCGKPAHEWSYDHADPLERTEPKRGAYSADVNHYAPRCRACHRRLDEAHRSRG